MRQPNDERPTSKVAEARRASRSAPTSLVALATVAASVLLLVRHQPHALAIVLAVAAAVWVPAAFVDWRTGRLPNAMTAAAAAVVIVAGTAVVTIVDHRHVWTGVLVATALFAGPMLLVALARRGRLGLGDVKLAASLGGGIGLVDPLLAPYALALACLIALAARWRQPNRDAARPFGPALVFATVIVLVAGSAVH